MTKQDVFEFSNYREYLLNWIGAQPKKGRGLRAAIAKSMNSPTSHLSQVLSGLSHFSFEQAEEVNDFLGHTTEESEYFLLLVQLSRAGTPKLRKRIESQIKKIQDRRLLLKERLEVKDVISPEAQARFYSSWQYAAVHILLTIEKYQTKEALAKFLGVSIRRTSEILDFLTSLGLAVQQNGRYQVGKARIHLGSDSVMISRHHINWRMQAIQALEDERFSENLHYSSVISISKDDVTRIKSLLVKAIENAKAIIRDSKEEELYSFCMDFFKA